MFKFYAKKNNLLRIFSGSDLLNWIKSIEERTTSPPPYCPVEPPNLFGMVKVDLEVNTVEEVYSTDLFPGGEYYPSCRTR